MNAGMETLKYTIPLYVAEYHDMSVDARGNKRLLELGGHRVARSRSTARANMKPIFAHIQGDPVTVSKRITRDYGDREFEYRPSQNVMAQASRVD